MMIVRGRTRAVRSWPAATKPMICDSTSGSTLRRRPKPSRYCVSMPHRAARSIIRSIGGAL
jgi:hypothetical protein